MADLNSLFKIEPDEYQNSETKLFRVSFDPHHEIFKGHFPDQPVVPGVLIIKLIVECASLTSGKKLLLAKVISCKFLNFIDPRVNPTLALELTIYAKDGLTDVKAVLRDESTIFTKASLTLKENTVA